MSERHLEPDPERWSDLAGATPSSDSLGAVFQRVRAATEPSGAAVAQWTRRGLKLTRHQDWRAPAPPSMLSATLLAVATVSAPYAWHHFVDRPAAPPVRVVEGPSQAPRSQGAPMVERPGRQLPEALPSSIADRPPAESVAPARRPRSGRVSRLDSRPDDPDEAALLARAFRSLRAAGDPAAALLDLDVYRRRFPDGRLAPEAATARAEALVALGRAGEALPILMAIGGTDGAGLTRDLRLARAEMLVKAERCGEAEGDFGRLIEGGAADVIRERALYGRASCRLRAGQTAAARSDLQAYVERFPDGRFSSAVRIALQKLATP